MAHWTCLFFLSREFFFLALTRQDHGLLIHPDIFYTNLLVCFLKSKLKNSKKGIHFAHALNKALKTTWVIIQFAPESILTLATPCCTPESFFFFFFFLNVK